MWEPGVSFRAFWKECRLSPSDEWGLGRAGRAACAEEKDVLTYVKKRKQLRMARLRRASRSRRCRQEAKQDPGSLIKHSKAGGLEVKHCGNQVNRVTLTFGQCHHHSAGDEMTLEIYSPGKNC